MKSSIGSHMAAKCKHTWITNPLAISRKLLLNRAPHWLQSMLLKALAYDINIKYLEGKKMLLADTLSRAYLPAEQSKIQAEFQSINAVAFLPMRDGRLEEIKHATAADPSLQQLKSAIHHGWPQMKTGIHLLVMPYFSIRDELAATNVLIFRGQRLVVPISMRAEIQKDISTQVM